VLFHLSTIWLLGLFIFPPLMIVTYFAWLNADDVAWCRATLARRSESPVVRFLRTVVEIPCDLARRLSTGVSAVAVPSIALLLSGLAMVVVGGIEAEYRLDPHCWHYVGRGNLAPNPVEQLIFAAMTRSIIETGVDGWKAVLVVRQGLPQVVSR